MVMIRITMRALMEKQKEVMQTLISLIEPTGREKGCLSYHVFRDIENQNVFSVLGEWDTRKALDRHIKSGRFGVLLGIRSLLSDPPSIQYHTISNTEGMEIVNTLRGKSTLVFSI